MRNIPYGKQEITQEDIDAVVAVLNSDFLTQGPVVAEFEKDFAAYVGSQYAVAVANGTAALHLAAIAVGVKAGDKVLTSPITFAASANCVLYANAEIDFVDIDKDTCLIDLQKLEQKLKADTKREIKGIIPVDFAGYPVRMDLLKEIADKYGCWIIEDACHAPGAYFTDKLGKKSFCGNGQYADLSVFSFHPVKHIATGEGGMITTNNVELYEKLIQLRTHGITKDQAKLKDNHGGWYYEMQQLGYNYRLTEMQAALGISQLKRAEQGMLQRQRIAKKYINAFKGSELITPYLAGDVKHAFHLFVVQAEARLDLYNFLKEKGIMAQVHYLPVHLHPYYSLKGFKKGDFPVAENYYRNCLSLPMFPSLKEEDLDYVIEQVLCFEKKTERTLV